ncbi:MAG: hypothetical protein A2341_28635 [Deltaproteobacteria bacterium RIFOXYB12_FULL_58_9]|nr:MAG: hypothetical protein A2341_28635 [Deltaproteobacteria bacterium RIFOXYB12_FULL_58_9]
MTQGVLAFQFQQQWAEVCFVPNWAAAKKSGPTYRFIAIRELLEQDTLPGIEEQPQLPFPTMQFMTGTYKLFGVVTNQLDISGGDLIRWHRLRCGKSEQIHAVMKNDLDGGRLPSGKFGPSAAWWGIMVMSLNLHAAFKKLGLGDTWVRKRMKAIRYALLNVAGRVIHHSRQVIVRLLASKRPAAASCGGLLDCWVTLVGRAGVAAARWAPHRARWWIVGGRFPLTCTGRRVQEATSHIVFGDLREKEPDRPVYRVCPRLCHRL